MLQMHCKNKQTEEFRSCYHLPPGKKHPRVLWVVWGALPPWTWEQPANHSHIPNHSFPSWKQEIPGAERSLQVCVNPWSIARRVVQGDLAGVTQESQGSQGNLKSKHWRALQSPSLYTPHTPLGNQREYPERDQTQTSYFTVNFYIATSFGWRPGEIPITLYRSKTMKVFSSHCCF